MNKMITEDIIKQALNESIDEFIIEEGATWDRLKGWADKYKLSSALRGLKNFAADYMNKRTNGKWNKQYGIYSDDTAKSIRSKNSWDYWMDLRKEASCFKEWLEFHAQGVNRVLNYRNEPEHSYYGKRSFFTSSTLMGVTGATEYIRQYCTYDNFVSYTSRYFTDYQGNEHIEQYIQNYIQNNLDTPQKALPNINYNRFLWSREGKAFFSQTMDQRNAYYDEKAQERSQNTEENRIGWYLSNVAKGIVETLNKKQNPEDYIHYYLTKQNFLNTFNKEYSGDDFQKNRMNLVYSWLINTLNRKIKSNGINSNIGQWLTYERFLKSQEGKQYQYLSQQQSAPTANKQ